MYNRYCLFCELVLLLLKVRMCSFSSMKMGLVINSNVFGVLGILILAFVSESVGIQKTCKLGQFRCETGQCIEKDQVCDSVRDCPSGIDEYVCTPKFRRGLCGHHRMRYRAQKGLGDLAQNVISFLLGGGPKKTGIFQCQFGGCLPLKRLCDGNINCIGGSDESEICENNSCLPGQFRCKYGACIPDWQMCNGRPNCPDGSDETPEACQNISCLPGQFRCRYGGCIPKDRICDIKKHCADGSDEFDFLCLITRAKMVERWGYEGKLINDELDKRDVEKEKERRRIINNSFTQSTNSFIPWEVTATLPNRVTTTTTAIPQPPSTTNTPPEVTTPKLSEIPSIPDNTVQTDGTETTPTSSDDAWITETDAPINSVVSDPVILSSTVSPATEASEATVIKRKECLLPEIPDNAEARIASCVNSPNAYFCTDATKSVPPGVVVQYDCSAGYLLYGSPAITCESSGNWSARPPECDPLIDVRFGFGSSLPNNFDPRCPKLSPPRGTSVECVLNDPKNLTVVSCSEKQISGVEARFYCSPYYRSSDLPSHYEKCVNGHWQPGNHDQFSCVPDCGLSEVPKTAYILNGQVINKRGQWPWFVSIYLRKDGELKYICGGALINENAVLTSAHCVTLRGATRNPADFMIFLGKQNIEIPDPDPFVQKRLVRKIIVEESFNYRTLDSDIAILALNDPAVLSFYVRPVCYPQSSNSFLEEYQLAAGSLGTVVGFGFTENGTLSKELRMAKLPVVSASDCADSHGDFFASMTRSTNYCAGYKNGTQVCNGDSGGGQYFRAIVRGTTRWYIQGLVSYGVPEAGTKKCASSQYAIFTRVGRYGDWIVRTLSRERLI